LSVSAALNKRKVVVGAANLDLTQDEIAEIEDYFVPEAA